MTDSGMYKVQQGMYKVKHINCRIGKQHSRLIIVVTVE